jgi:hypothetical protein
MVLAVVGHPADHRTLHRDRSQHGEDVLDGAVGPERAVSQEAVKADRDAEAREQVQRRQDGQVGPPDHLVPEQWHGHQEGHERHYDGRDVDVAVQSRHEADP